jgi:hypothetical protein
MYNTVDSIPRADISTVLMEAVAQEKFYVGQEIFPVFPSALEVGRYPRFKVNETELMKPGKAGGSTKRGSTGTYNEVERKFVWDQYQTEEYGLEERVDDVVARRMENFFDAEMVTGKFLMNALMLDYEMECAAAAFDPSTFTATNAAVAYTAANAATMDVPSDMNALIERLTLLGENSTVIIMSLPVWNRIRASQKMQTYMYGFLNVTQGGSQITPDMFAAVFGGVRLIIAKKAVDVSPKGVAPNLVPVWGNDYIGVFNVAPGDFLNGGIGRTIIWDADSPGGLFTSESYRNEARRGNMLRVRSNRVIKIMNTACGQLIRTNFA